MAKNQIRPRLIDPQRRVILPPEVMEALHVDIGDHVAFSIEDGMVRLHRVEFVLK